MAIKGKRKAHNEEAADEIVEELVAGNDAEPNELTIETLEGGAFNPDRVRFLVYGESGVGKTVFASTWKAPIFLDIDDGMSSVTRKVDRVWITEWAQLETICDWLRTGDHNYKTVVIDSLNEGQQLAMAAIIEEFPQIRRSYGSLPGESDYGKMLYDFDQLIRKFKMLNMNVVYVAQATTKVFDTDIIQPQLIGKATSRNLCRMMDVVGYIYKAQTQNGSIRMMSFDAANYVTKDRSSRLPAVMENPTYSKLEKLWR